MKVLNFVEQLKRLDINFYTGVPDSLLKPLNTYLMCTYGISDNHIIAANEGNAVALAAGYHLSTGRTPVVYLQNSGVGNIVNPVTSLLNKKIYGIPCVFIIGWRGEPGIPDEPQHLFQGKITLDILKTLDMSYFVIDKSTSEEELILQIGKFKYLLDCGISVAFVVKRDSLTFEGEKVDYQNEHPSSREEIINVITESAGDDIIISTTGKTSRELFEIRDLKGQTHDHDFLTIGSMGHCSSLALGIALNIKDKRVWCLDGDGSLLMHMGAMAVIGEKSPKNLIHVVINNGAHESVGGQPTVANHINLEQIAKGCGYRQAHSVSNVFQLQSLLKKIEKQHGPIFIEVKSAIGSREDLGRPTIEPMEIKNKFMKFLSECN